MTLIRRLEILEVAVLRQDEDSGYKLVMIEDDEMPEDGIARSGLMNSAAAESF